MQTPPAVLPRDLRPFLDLINQVFEIEKKAGALTEPHSIQRNIKNMRNWFERELVMSSEGQPVRICFTFHNPKGEDYNETRTDCDASIAGTGTDNLVITEVIKPIVWLEIGGAGRSIVQQAVVVVESQQTAAVSAAVLPSMQLVEAGPTISFTTGASVQFPLAPSTTEETTPSPEAGPKAPTAAEQTSAISPVPSSL